MRVVIGDEGFQVAFIVASIGAGLAWWSIRRESFVVGFAAVAIVATLVALRVEYDVDFRLVVGVALVGLAWLIDPAVPVLRTVMLVGGAVLVAGDLGGVPGWMQALAVVGTLVAAPLALSLDRAVPRAMPVLVLVTVAGIYACAPDTEFSLVMLGALVPTLVLVLEPRLRAGAATASLTALVVWLAVVEGRGRPGAVIGAVASLGVLLVAPLLRWRAASLRAVVLLVLTQAGLVLYVSRVAGLRESAWAAAALCVPAFALAAVVLTVVNRRARE